MKSPIAFLLCGLVAGATVGFLGANYLNRTSVNSSTAPAPPVAGNPTGQSALSEADIKALLEKADANAADFQLQAETATTLYSESLRTLNPGLMREAARLLSRVEETRKNDRVLIVFLGNVYFDIAAMAKDGDAAMTARGYYERALALQGGDAEVLADLGMTYTLVGTPDHNKAISYYTQAIAVDAKNERALAGFVDAYIGLANKTKASEHLAKLKTVNPNHPRIAELSQKVSN